jgi:hypothetical protein
MPRPPPRWRTGAGLRHSDGRHASHIVLRAVTNRGENGGVFYACAFNLRAPLIAQKFSCVRSVNFISQPLRRDAGAPRRFREVEAFLEQQVRDSLPYSGRDRGRLIFCEGHAAPSAGTRRAQRPRPTCTASRPAAARNGLPSHKPRRGAQSDRRQVFES